MENLKIAMRQKNITSDMVAALLHLHRNTVYSKLNEATAFTVEEAMKIKEAFFPEYDLFFLFKKKTEQG